VWPNISVECAGCCCSGVCVVTDGRSTTGEQHCTLKRLHSSFKVVLDLSPSDLPGHEATQWRRWAPTFRRNIASEIWRHDVLLQFRNRHSRLHGVATQNTTHSRQAAMARSVQWLGYGKDNRGIGFRFLAGGTQDFSPLRSFHTRSRTHTQST